MKTINISFILTGILIFCIACDGSELFQQEGKLAVYYKPGSDGFPTYKATNNGKTVIPYESNYAGIRIEHGCFTVVNQDSKFIILDSNGKNMLNQYPDFFYLYDLNSYFIFAYYTSWPHFVGGICDSIGNVLFEPDIKYLDHEVLDIVNDEVAIIRHKDYVIVIDLSNGEEIVRTTGEIKILRTAPLSFVCTTQYSTFTGTRNRINIYGKNGTLGGSKKLNAKPVGNIFPIQEGGNFISYKSDDGMFVGYINTKTGTDEYYKEIFGFTDDEI